jgi:hypothetical protein
MKNNSEIEKIDKHVARPLAVIADLIKKERASANADSKKHWTVIAYLLVEAFTGFDGDWNAFQTWFNRNDFDFGFDSGKDRMLALSNLEQSRAPTSAPIPSFTKAMRPDYKWPEDEVRAKIKRTVEGARRFAQAAMERRNEEELIRQLAIKIIDVGFKVLSVKFHPDKRGGSADAMRRLNAAKAMLKERI